MAWVLFAMNNTWFNPLWMLLGAIWPDADHRNAPIGKFIPLWLIFKHRTWTHTFWGLIGFSCIVWGFFEWRAGVAFAIGYFSHMFLDATTPSGIGWWKPRKFYKRKSP